MSTQRELLNKVVLAKGQTVSYPVICYENDSTTRRNITGLTLTMKIYSPEAPATILHIITQSTHSDPVNGVSSIPFTATHTAVAGHFDYILRDSNNSWYQVGSVEILDVP
jgi:hypothetical protein